VQAQATEEGAKVLRNPPPRGHAAVRIPARIARRRRLSWQRPNGGHGKAEEKAAGPARGAAPVRFTDEEAER